MKITFAANHGEIGGGEVMLLTMAEIARDEGHDVTIVAPEIPGDLIDKAIDLDVRAVGIHGAGTAAYLAGLRRWDAQKREGLLWCNGLRPAFATAGRKHRVVALHQLPRGKQAVLAKAALRGADLVTVPSAWMRDEMGIDAHVLDNWTAFDPPKPKSFAGFPDDRPIRIGFLGRVTVEKGLLALTEALHILEATDQHKFQLVVGGEARFSDQQEADSIEEALDSLETQPKLLGWVTREAFFEEVDLAVFPSLYPESFGLVAAEAMAMGVPFVVTDAGALADVANLNDRFVAIPGHGASLAYAIQAAVAGYTPDAVAASRERWEEHFSPAAGRARFTALLHELERTSS